MIEKLVRILEKIRWIMMLFVTTNFQKKINENIAVYSQYHIIICLWLAVLIGGALSFVLSPIWLAIAIGSASSFIVVTIGKEILMDLFGDGTFDWWDILANLSGSIFGGTILSLIVITLKAAEIIN